MVIVFPIEVAGCALVFDVFVVLVLSGVRGQVVVDKFLKAHSVIVAEQF